jgi:hypothetical protein
MIRDSSLFIQIGNQINSEIKNKRDRKLFKLRI